MENKTILPAKGTGKFISVIIDTVNSLQDTKYILHLQNEGKANFDAWRDFGVDVLGLINTIKMLPADIVLVPGREGTGKTVGVSFLNPEETLMINSDNKPLSFTGWRSNYSVEKENYMEHTTYEKVVNALQWANSNRKTRLVIFLLCHVDTYDAPTGKRERMRVLGKMATKLNIEGSTIHTYYTMVDPIETLESKKYKLLTQNTGFNTGRSPMGMFLEAAIPNNYQLILNKILEDRGENFLTKETTTV